MREKIKRPFHSEERNGKDYWYDATGQAVCGGLLRKKNGLRCGRIPEKGSNRCDLHGANTPTGPSAPTYIDGTHARYKPELFQNAEFSAAYARALRDENVLDLSPELAIITARISELLAADPVEFGELWQDLEKAADDIEKAYAKLDDGLIRLALSNLRAIIQVGLNEAYRWGELYRAIDSKRKVSATDQQRRTKAQTLIPVEDVMWLLSRIAMIMNESSDERSKRRVIELVQSAYGPSTNGDTIPVPVDAVAGGDE